MAVIPAGRTLRVDAGPRHVVIIGAARSGTRVLRDTLARATGMGQVPYDIGFVWRYGNEQAPDDVLVPSAIGARSRRFIRKFIDRYAAGSPSGVIEKTVGNCFRVPAVVSVIPDAYVIHIVRDGVDTIESARRQWTAPLDLRYAMGKLPHVPLRLAFRCGANYLASFAYRWGPGDGRQRSWGPRYPGIDADLARHDLLVVCARQWRESVRHASRDLARIARPVVQVRYEDLVNDPETELRRLVDFLALPYSREQVRRAAMRLVSVRQGVGRRSLSRSELAVVEAEAGSLLSELGYEPALVGEPQVLSPADRSR
ncbi:MAG TPA: sulfotransferase [Actinopolymorphaceae bacterium]